jgi:hypothetical protein
MSPSNSPIELLTYQEVLNQIQGKENHLLIGNGFNYGLGVDTSYSKIFQKMIEKDLGLYKEAESLVQECDEDLERFIGRLTDDINPENHFLKKFVNNKIKIDFMKATQSIVKSAIKNVYSEKNSEVYLFLKNFTNYFTLNYDPFLYLLLLHYKSSKLKEKTTLVLQPSLKFIEEDLNARESNIYAEIKHARDNGTLELSGVDDAAATTSELKTLKKARFITVITEYSERNSKGWKKKDIELAVNLILEEEKKHQVIDKVDDSSRQLNLFDDKTEFVFDTESTTQNLFFLHGAFHIYKDGKSVKKITQKTDKALYERIEDILNSEELELICIFQKENKKDLIEENSYLLNCLNKLNTLSGIMVIIGSSLDDNDDHVFEEIVKSNIKTLYISSMDNDKENILEKATRKFPSKTIHLFDAKTISYEMPAAKNDYSNTKEEKHV